MRWIALIFVTTIGSLFPTLHVWGIGLADQKGEGGAVFAAGPSFQDDFGPDWEATQKQWQVATWKQNGAEMSPDRCKTDGKGILTQTVLPGEPFRGGSLQSALEFPYGRWEARLKPSSVAGVNNSFFTKDWDDLAAPGNKHNAKGKQAEVDMEFLTYTFHPGGGKVHLAIHLQNQPNYFVVEQEIGFNPSDDFHVWGMDILPDRVVWRVDGRTLKSYIYPRKGLVDPNYEMFFNSWTKQKWIHGPPSRTATYEIDWVKFYPLIEAK